MAIQKAFLVDPFLVAKQERRRKSAERAVSAGVTRGPRQPRAAKVFDCTACKLKGIGRSGEIAPLGHGRMKIAVVVDGPSMLDDRYGDCLHGAYGELVRDAFADVGISLEHDCVRLFAYRCLAGEKDKKPAKVDHYIRCCEAKTAAFLQEFKPRLIVTLGAQASKGILHPPFDAKDATFRGMGFPSRKYESWVGCCWSPSYVLDSEKKADARRRLFAMDITRACSLLERPFPRILPENDFTILQDLDTALAFLEVLSETTDRVRFDYETNGLRPYMIESPKVHCVSFAVNPNHGYWLPLDYQDAWSPEDLARIKDALRKWLVSPAPKVIQNYAMEEHWSSACFGVTINNCVADTMVNAHIVDERRDITGLEFQSFQLTGVNYKDMVNKKDIANEPRDRLSVYSTLDSRYTALADDTQQEIFRKVLSYARASSFFMRCLPALVRMEKRGILLDRQLLISQQNAAKDECKTRAEYFASHDYVQRYKSTTGKDEWDPGKDQAFIDLFYKVLQVKTPSWTTDAGGIPVDKEAISFIIRENRDDALSEFCNTLLEWRRYNTLLTNFLNSFESSLGLDGRMHPSFLLHVVASYRSSSEDPNFQNLPKRNEEQADFRKIVIPAFDFMTEIDASGSEVATMAMLSRDPVLCRQVIELVDLHRYWAARLYAVREQDVTKKQRQNAKNMFVFPMFYGSYWRSIAARMELPEPHIKAIEQEFWQMYRDVRAWQEQTIRTYERTGFVEMPMGFRRHEPLSRNQLFNTAVQGTSFHMLLESIREVDENLAARQMQSYLNIEVHDSIVGDVKAEEREDVHKIMLAAMTRKQFSWQGDIPRRADLASGTNWGSMTEVKQEAA